MSMKAVKNFDAVCIVLFALMLVLRVFDNEHVLSVRSPDCAMNVTAMTWLYSLLVIAVISLVLSVIGLILSVRARKTLPAAETLVTGNIIIMVNTIMAHPG